MTAIKRDGKFNQTAPSVIVFNPNWIPTPDTQTPKDLWAEDKYSLPLPSSMTLQKKAPNPSQKYFQSKTNHLWTLCYAEEAMNQK